MNPPRKRLRRHDAPGEARYLTCSCYHRLPLLGNDAIKDAFVERLAIVRAAVPFLLLAWVVMPEHFHLLIVPSLPDHPASSVLHTLKRPLAERVIKRWRELRAPILERITGRDRAAHFWQAGGGYDRNVVTEVQEKIDYMHNNPVRRGLASNPVDWVWSSARWYAGVREGPIAIDPLLL